MADKEEADDKDLDNEVDDNEPTDDEVRGQSAGNGDTQTESLEEMSQMLQSLAINACEELAHYRSGTRQVVEAGRRLVYSSSVVSDNQNLRPRSCCNRR